MVNSILKQTLNDGQRNLVVLINLTGDGSGEETATALIDPADYNMVAGRPTPVYTAFKLNYFSADLTGFSASLAWDGSTDVPFLEIIEGYSYGEFRPTGGLINNAAAKTGKIMLTTVGLGSGDRGHILLELVKKP